MKENPIDTARRAYSESKPASDMPRNTQPIKSGKSSLELASLGYSQSAREKEIRKEPARASLNNVLNLIDQGRLPGGLRSLAKSPPSREEARYLPRDVQTLTDDLTMLDKMIESIPKLEQEVQGLKNQRDLWTYNAIQSGITDKQQPAGNVDYPFELDNLQKILSNLTSEMDSITRGVVAYAGNSPELLKKSSETIETLSKELEAPIPYREAKSGLPAIKKSVRAWLNDVEKKPALDDRILAQKVLESAGIDHKGILKEVQRQGMSLVDRTVLEAKEKAGATSPVMEVKQAQATGTTIPANKPL